jgi:cation diffusion facilitator CzcD-associated flavoprotein CzcO
MTLHTTPRTVDALVIGAGFSGLAILHHLREAGFETLVVDAADGIGGTWWVNNYPGVRTDSEFHYYSFSFSKEVREEWTWTERYPSGQEVLAYLNFVADRLDLRRDIELNSRVIRAEYDEAANHWVTTFDDGRTIVSTYLVSGMGVLSQAIYPDIPGIDTFEGEHYHTAYWPRDGVELSGKRVGIIGLGASGIQVVPVVAPLADQFYVFQRTPNFVVETNNDKVSDEWMQYVRDNYDAIFEQAAGHPFGVAMEYPDKSALDVGPEERRRIFESKWLEGGFHFANECFTDLATNVESAELASEFIRSKIREIVKDPETAELLCPKGYAFNGKRVPTGHNYYDTFNRENVHLVDTKTVPITAVTPKGIKVGDTEYELDVIIFATGFDAMTGTLTNIDIVGRNGRILRDKWNEEGLRSNLGISVNGFPNFFMSLGPQTPYSNLPVPIQLGAQWLQRLLVWARDNGVARVEATPESEEWWANETARAGEATVMASEGEKAGAWFLGHNVPGKPRAFQVYMGGGQVYQQYCREAEQNGYRSFLAESAQPADVVTA